MKLQNTKQYYKDLAAYYFLEQKAQLMLFFKGLAEEPKYEHSDTDTNDWFAQQGIERPNMETFL